MIVSHDTTKLDETATATARPNRLRISTKLKTKAMRVFEWGAHAHLAMPSERLPFTSRNGGCGEVIFGVYIARALCAKCRARSVCAAVCKWLIFSRERVCTNIGERVRSLKLTRMANTETAGASPHAHAPLRRPPPPPDNRVNRAQRARERARAQRHPANANELSTSQRQ